VLVIGVSIPSATIVVSSVTDSAGNTYTRQSHTHGTSVSGEVWTAPNTAYAASNAITVVLGTAIANWSMAIGSYHGVAGFDSIGGAQSTTTTSVSVSVIANYPNELLIAHVFTPSGVTTSSVTGGYVDVPGTGTSYPVHQSYFVAGGTGGTNSFQETINSSMDLVAVLLGLGPLVPEWSDISSSGKPFVTVSPIGLSSGTALANNGADYGPDSAGTSTSGIQEAINSGALLVVLQAGTFSISVTIVPANNTVIRGAGKYVTSIFTANGANCSAIATTFPQNVEIEDLTIDGNAANQTTSLSSLAATLVHNNGVATSAWSGLHFYRVLFQNSMNHALSLFTDGGNNMGFDLVVRECEFAHIGVTTGTVGTNGMAVIFQGPSYGSDISGNYFRYIFGASLDTSGLTVASQFHTGVRFVGNFCRNTYWVALDLSSLSNAVIEANSFANDESGWFGSSSAIFLESPDSTNGHTNVVISGNSFLNWSVASLGNGVIYVAANADATQARNIVISGNVSRGVSSTDNTNTIHITVDSVNGILCIGNMIDITDDTPNGTGQAGGIYVRDSVANSTGEISHNTILGAASATLAVSFHAAMADYPNLLVVDNVGFNPYGFGVATPTFPASGTSVQNNFPFPVTVRLLSAGTMTAFSIEDT
jgi:hypothetical protein